jgi:hypothetical protein
MKELHRLLDQALSRDPRTALIAVHTLEADLEWVNIAPRRLPSAAANPMSPDELMARAIVDEVWRRRAGEPPRPFSTGSMGAMPDDPVAW